MLREAPISAKPTAEGRLKRCSWGQPESEFGQGDGPCNSFARGKTGLCASHGALVQDKRVHGGAHSWGYGPGSSVKPA
ncbi:hypothetical protein H5410_053940 [Solanum commersonii]|uniref:Uncharacterized protein n=1 Tax=Solanum commersonii TaxID=4109 RepID=A0A9J5X4U5_SOLCO|nr:hypothetical protein H5410_053940 [Solanum commersonii]